VLSPVLFNVYVDCLAEALKQSDLSCHVLDVYFGCLFYADDILLLPVPASVGDLQKCWICVLEKVPSLILFLLQKSSLLVVGKNCFSTIQSLRICW